VQNTNTESYVVSCRVVVREIRQRDRSSEKSAELPPPHSITSSARARSDGGTVRPSALAALRLITRSNFVGCSTGRSLGFAPFKILSTKCVGAAAKRRDVHTVRHETTIVCPLAEAVKVRDSVTSRGDHNLAPASISQRIGHNE